MSKVIPSKMGGMAALCTFKVLVGKHYGVIGVLGLAKGLHV